MLTIEGLTIRYAGATALDALDLTILPDEMFVLLGASGSGKTTLLRAIAGFVPPSAGRIVLNGLDLSPLPPHRRPVNTMFQSYALFPHLTVAENIAFGLRPLRLSRAARQARVDEMLVLVRLEGFGTRRPDQISGGQQQRVALARSLAPRPEVLLLDEPLSALDQNLRAETREELVALRRRLGTSFVLVTHDQEEALTMADRIGVMRHGQMAQVGPPETLYEHPANRFVAEFLGAANILPAMVRAATAEGCELVLANRLARCSAVRCSARAAVGEQVMLAIRPERLSLGCAGENSLSGEVVARLYAGSVMTLSVRLDDGTVVRATCAPQSASAAMIGERITLGFSADAVIVLRH